MPRGLTEDPFGGSSLLQAFLFVMVVAAAVPCSAFYIPGAKPTYYKKGDKVDFMVNSIRSLSVMYTRGYYRLPFCSPSIIRETKETIGELLWGEHLMNSLYTVNMLEDSQCTMLPNCDPDINTQFVKRNIDWLEWHIERGYRGYMNIDNLPVFNNGTPIFFNRCASLPSDQNNTYLRGYALGVPRQCTGEGSLINNHLEFTIGYNERPFTRDKSADEKEYMVVGLTVAPFSVRYSDELRCDSTLRINYRTPPLSTDDVRSGQTVRWTYSVRWQHIDVQWATRWDAYFHTSAANNHTAFHWAYVSMSVIAVLTISTLVAALLLRMLRLDFQRYNAAVLVDDLEETGWKLVHADVFRPPDRASLLSILVGNGYQIIFMVGGVLLFASFGFLSPSRRGALLNAVLLLYATMSISAGYICGVLLKYFNCQSWKSVFVCGCGFPGLVCIVFLFRDIVSAFHKSASEVSSVVILAIFILLFCVNTPLTFIGASIAFRQERLTNPIRVGRLAREIPVQPLLNSNAFICVVPPLFPVCVVLVEIHFIMQAFWAGQVFYVFGFLSLVSCLWCAVCALVTVFQLYYVLCQENHRWWWLAFLIPGCFGVHIFIYAVYYFFAFLNISDFASKFLYFVYMGIASLAYGLAAGSIGLTAGLVFVRKIYSNIKLD